MVQRQNDISRHIGGDRQRDLRQALGALEEDPAQLDALLKLTERVIFDSEDVARAEPAIRRKATATSAETGEPGPDSLSVDAIGRHHDRKKRRLASGDILVLLDALMAQLGEGGPTTSPSRPPGDEVRPAEDGDEGEEEPPPAPPPYDALADTCKRKVGRLIRRMIKQLELTEHQSARRVVVQLAAVLSVVHALRMMEQRTEWRTKRLRLVDPDHEWLLFESGALALAWGSSSLSSLALQEGDCEPFQELSLSVGLLAWLAWDVNVDIRTAVQRRALDSDKEEDPWRPLQILATAAAKLAADPDAGDTLAGAATRTPKRGTDVGSWLSAHLDLADRLAEVTRAPETFKNLARAPRPGDLVVLGVTVDPRVRVVLAVEPSERDGQDHGL